MLYARLYCLYMRCVFHSRSRVIKQWACYCAQKSLCFFFSTLLVWPYRSLWVCLVWVRDNLVYVCIYKFPEQCFCTKSVEKIAAQFIYIYNILYAAKENIQWISYIVSYTKHLRIVTWQMVIIFKRWNEDYPSCYIAARCVVYKSIYIRYIKRRELSSILEHFIIELSTTYAYTMFL